MTRPALHAVPDANWHIIAARNVRSKIGRTGTSMCKEGADFRDKGKGASYIASGCRREVSGVHEDITMIG